MSPLALFNAATAQYSAARGIDGVLDVRVVSGGTGGTAATDVAVLLKPFRKVTAAVEAAITPSAGKAIRVYAYRAAAKSTNTADVDASWAFGATANQDLINLSQYGGVYAHTIKGGVGYVQGAVNAPVNVTLSAAQTVDWNFDYVEV